MKTQSTVALVALAASVILSGCSSSGGLDEAGTSSCEQAMKLRTGGGSIEERQITIDEAFLQARMSGTPEFQDLVANADANSGGVIRFEDLVDVCRGYGIQIPDRE